MLDACPTLPLSLLFLSVTHFSLCTGKKFDEESERPRRGDREGNRDRDNRDRGDRGRGRDRRDGDKDPEWASAEVAKRDSEEEEEEEFQFGQLDRCVWER